MATQEFNVLVPAVAALTGALIGSVAPVVVGLINARAESRRERLRLAVQMAIEDHQHMMGEARRKAGTGTRVGVPPISAVLAYHVEVLEQLQKAGSLEPKDFVLLRARAKAAFDALAPRDE
jgi:hypothetical protein